MDKSIEDGELLSEIHDLEVNNCKSTFYLINQSLVSSIDIFEIVQFFMLNINCYLIVLFREHFLTIAHAHRVSYRFQKDPYKCLLFLNKKHAKILIKSTKISEH